MDYVLTQAENVLEDYIKIDPNLEKAKQAIKKDLSDFDIYDQSKYIDYIIEHTNSAEEYHKIVCTAPDPLNCRVNMEFEDLKKYLTWESTKINKLLHNQNNTQSEFSYREIEEINSRIDVILAKLKDLGLENQNIYSEIKDLKTQVTKQDKKTFRQLVLGKMGDLVMDETGDYVKEVLKDNNFTLSDMYTFITGEFTRLLNS